MDRHTDIETGRLGRLLKSK